MSKIGKIIFISGAVLLGLCAVTLPFWKNFDSRLMTIVFIVLLASSVMIVAGEMLKFSGRRHEQKLGLGFMDYYRQSKTASGKRSGRKQEPDDKRRCAFCGLRLIASPIPAKLNGINDMSISETQAGHCEECGKLCCPQCAFRKGVDMGLKSFRCPACSGRVV
jgi:hypothetical protein